MSGKAIATYKCWHIGTNLHSLNARYKAIEHAKKVNGSVGYLPGILGELPMRFSVYPEGVDVSAFDLKVW